MPKRYSDPRSVSVANTDSPLAPANGHRAAILISAPQTNRITLGIRGPAVLDQGITIQAGSNPLLLSAAEWG